MGGLLSTSLGLASIACQSAICCCNVLTCCTTAARGADGVSAKLAKIFYVVLLAAATLLAAVMRYNGDDWGINIGAWEVHCSDTNDEHAINNVGGVALGEEQFIYCKGDAAVYRISFVMATFFGVMSLLTISNNAMHRGFWGLKIGCLLVSLLLCFFIPNSFFDNSGYAWIARLVSMGFLLLQILILIDFAYQWNDSWVAKAYPDDGMDDQMWLVAILGSAAALYLASFVGIPLLFTYYGDCGTGIAFSTITLIGILLFTGVTLFRDRIVGQEGAILPAAVVGAYTTYLCWSALDSNPHNECKPGLGGDTNDTAHMVMGMIIAVVSLSWSAVSVTESLGSLVTGGDAPNSGEPNASTPLYSVEGADGRESRVERESFEHADSDSDSDWSESNLWAFHLVMFTASCYMAMLLTNWGASEGAHGNENGFVSEASMWVKIVSQWLTILLFTWTIVAPRVMEEMGWDRDFDF